MNVSHDTKKRKVGTAVPSSSGGLDPLGTSAVLDPSLAMDNLNESIDRRIAARVKQAVDEETSSLKSAVEALQAESRDLRQKYDEAKLLCEALEQAVQVLKNDVNWAYSAPVIPRSHWVERGHNENDVGQIMGWVNSMTYRTKRLRDGNESDISCHCDYFNDSELLHDVSFLPHWQEFADAISLQRAGVGLRLSLENVQLDQSVLAILGPSLKMKLKGLSFEKNMFTGSCGMKFATETVWNNPMLQTFSWQRNRIGPEYEEEAAELISSLSSLPNLSYVCLNGRDGDAWSYNTLRPIFTANSGLKKLLLYSNALTTNGGTELSDYIASNPPLDLLNLNTNKLNDEDAALIAQALRGNSNLEHLYIHGNDLTQVGFGFLHRAVMGDSSFNSIYNCNHSCTIHGGDGNVRYLDANNRGSQAENRSAKMYRLFSSRNKDGSNARHLDAELGEECVVLIPHVLSSVGRFYNAMSGSKWKYGDHVGPMTIVFELARSWKMPEMYENQRLEITKNN